MNNLTIIRLGKDQNGFTVHLEKSPVPYPNMRDTSPFRIDPSRPADAPGAVLQHGGSLWEKLTAHEAVKKALQRLIENPDPTENALALELIAANSERFYWETLHSSNDFLALQDNPIIRIPDSEDTRLPIRRYFAPPLKILAFMSAIGRDEYQQCLHLIDAVVHAEPVGAPVALTLCVGKRENLTSLREEYPGLDIREMPLTREDMDYMVELLSPHIVHFFCHGSADHQVQELLLGNMGDHENEGPASIHYPVEFLRREAWSKVWLLVLNCCDGAAAPEGFQSIAYEAARSRIPAVIAMMEPFDLNDANEFARAFYRPALHHLHGLYTQLENGAEAVALNWCKPLWHARSAVQGRHGPAADNRQWAVPVLYARSPDVKVSPKPAAPAGASAEEFLRFLQFTGTRLPPELLAAIAAQAQAPVAVAGTGAHDA